MTVYQPAEVGFQIIENILSEKECVSLLSTLSESEFDRGRAGARHLMRVPQVANLTQDPRLIQIAQRELGKEPFPFRAILFEKSWRANWLVVWHQDTTLPLRERFEQAGWGPWSW